MACYSSIPLTVTGFTNTDFLLHAVLAVGGKVLQKELDRILIEVPLDGSRQQVSIQRAGLAGAWAIEGERGREIQKMLVQPYAVAGVKAFAAARGAGVVPRYTKAGGQKLEIVIGR